jgi:gamma-glutamylcyclotransferase (GGCT)/AIG2-like uncharacterized protein YtfP
MAEPAGPPLFVYGTLLFPPVLERVIGRRPEMCRAAAPGFAARKMPDVIWPGMISLEMSVAGGCLLLDLTPEELALLDAWEGEPYRRKEIDVVDDLGRVVSAGAYLVDEAEVTDEPWASRAFYERELPDFLSALDAAALSEG